MVSIESLKSPRFLLFGLGGAIAAIHLTLTATVDHFPLFSNGLLLWTGVGILLWSRRYDLPLGSNLGGSLGGKWGSKLCGILLLGWGLLNSVAVKPSELFLHLFPVTAALGVVLIASGFSGLKHYRGELLVLAFLALVPEAVAKVVDISILTAQYATHLLQWTGFEAIRQGVVILLPAGGIEVADTCSGMSVILHLLGIAVLVVQMFPTGWRLRAAILAAAIALGFAINGVRVAVLAALAGAENPQAFKYWHIGDGSHFFSIAALVGFGLICYGLMGRQKILD